MSLRLYLGIALMITGFFWDSISEIASKKPVINNEYNTILKLKAPSDAYYNELKNIKSLVTGPDQTYDRELIAIFHNEIANRLEKYENISSIAFENFYYDSAKLAFTNRISNKYKGLGDEIYKVILSTLGENESILTKEEMGQLAEKMRAIAWILLN
jgi:hypothetical protein